MLLGLGAVGLAFGVMDGLRLGWTPAGVWMARHLPILRDEEQHRPTGSTYFIAAALVSFLVFDMATAANAVLFQAVADPVAAAVGMRWGRHRWEGKSLEGSLAYLVAASGAGALLLPTALGLGAPLLGLAALAATLFEFLPLPLDDNLRVPLLTAGVIVLAQGLF